MARAAFDAFRRFSKDQGHAAQLNIVDCAVYALAKVRSQPLLFKGDDFDRTDIGSALV
jgi:ribonuclease VapC